MRWSRLAIAGAPPSTGGPTRRRRSGARAECEEERERGREGVRDRARRGEEREKERGERVKWPAGEERARVCGKKKPRLCARCARGRGVNQVVPHSAFKRQQAFPCRPRTDHSSTPPQSARREQKEGVERRRQKRTCDNCCRWSGAGGEPWRSAAEGGGPKAPRRPHPAHGLQGGLRLCVMCRAGSSRELTP